MKKVLVVHYSQSGQLDNVVREFTRPLVESDDVSVTFENIKPVEDFPFPWPFLTFLDTFPESVYLDPPPIEAPGVSGDENFDLVILAYQVWFLSPALPMTAFLQHPVARQLLDNTPVVTLIACRNMWLMAQEDMKQKLTELNASLVGNVAMVDEAGSLLSFFATPLWVLTGRKGPFWGGLIPKAGVSEKAMVDSERFGRRIRDRLRVKEKVSPDMLRGLAAVRINEGLISSERTGKRAFRIWGRLLRALGPRGAWQRKPVLVFYSVFLVAMILTVVPAGMLIKRLLSPFTRKRIARQKAYFSAPSGD
ncbi:MAG: dialkylresorcinol condensing enzyme [Marinobacter sp.]|uniref:dialkylrecorsinol condensing enzyme n=1 Tax=Marinobacter sp. TaxID=50741 RepID=UPI003F9D6089